MPLINSYELGCVSNSTKCTQPPGFVSISRLAEYSGLSSRTLWSHIYRARDPIPHHRVGRRVLVFLPEFDEWMLRR